MPKTPPEVKLMSKVPGLISAKEVRDNKRYKQSEIADQTGLSESTVSRLINGANIETVSLGKAVILAEWLGVPVTELFEREPA